MGRRLTFKDLPAIEREDAGASLELEILNEYADEVGVYATIGSWDESKRHKVLAPFIGQPLRISVEIMPGPADESVFLEYSDAKLEEARKEASASIGNLTQTLLDAEDPLLTDTSAANAAHDTILSLYTRIDAIDRVRLARQKSLMLEE